MFKRHIGFRKLYVWRTIPHFKIHQKTHKRKSSVSAKNQGRKLSLLTGKTPTGVRDYKKSKKRKNREVVMSNRIKRLRRK